MSQNNIDEAIGSPTSNNPTVASELRLVQRNAGAPPIPPHHHASLSLADMPEDIIFLIIEIIVGDKRRINRFLPVESVAARSLIALRHSCRILRPIVEQMMRFLLVVYVEEMGTNGMRALPGDAKTTWGPIAGTEISSSLDRGEGEAIQLVICVPDFVSSRTLHVPSRLIEALTIRSVTNLDLKEPNGAQRHFPALLARLARHSPHLVSLDLGICAYPNIVGSALWLWANTLTKLRLASRPFACLKDAEPMLLPNLRELSFSIGADVEIPGLGVAMCRVPFVAPALQVLNVNALTIHPELIYGDLARFATTLRKLTVCLEMVVEMATHFGPMPCFQVLHELTAPVAVLDILGVAMPQLRSLVVHPNSGASFHSDPVPFPSLLHVTRVELNKHLITRHLLDCLAAAVPALTMLKLGSCPVPREEHVAPVHFPALSELIVNSTPADLNNLVLALDGPHLTHVRMTLERGDTSTFPAILQRVWSSISHLTLVVEYKLLQLPAPLLTTLPQLTALHLAANDVVWTDRIVPALPSLTSLTTNTACLRRLTHRPVTLRGLVELTLSNVLTEVPEAVFNTLQRFHAPAVRAHVLETLARMPSLTVVNIQHINCDAALREWKLVYRQGSPVWRAVPRIERLSGAVTITHRLVVVVERVVDADKAVRQMEAVVLWTAKYAVKRPMPLDVVVAAGMDEHVVSQIVAMVEGFPVESVTGRVVVGGGQGDPRNVQS